MPEDVYVDSDIPELKLNLSQPWRANFQEICPEVTLLSVEMPDTGYYCSQDNFSWDISALRGQFSRDIVGLSKDFWDIFTQ
jgi:hypothetical protein